MDSAAEFLGLPHTAKGGLADDVEPALGVRAVGVGEEGAVLLREEEAGGNGIDADALAELLCAL